jgi:hypothetical protein
MGDRFAQLLHGRSLYRECDRRLAADDDASVRTSFVLAARRSVLVTHTHYE